jgi:hypothetical protein
MFWLSLKILLSVYLENTLKDKIAWNIAASCYLWPKSKNLNPLLLSWTEWIEQEVLSLWGSFCDSFMYIVNNENV